MKTKDEVIDGYMTRHTPEGQAIRAELENIWENGYIRGRRDFGALDITEELHRQYNKGYANGHDAGKDEAYKELSGWTAEEGKAQLDGAYRAGYDKGVDDGMHELWWIIKKLYLNPDEGGFSVDDNFRIFGRYTTNFSEILRNYAPEEVIEKVKSYEESKNSAPTNRDKFEEVFGFRPEEHRNSIVIMAENGDLRKIILDEPYNKLEDNDNA